MVVRFYCWRVPRMITTAQALSLDDNGMRLAATREAIESLGLLVRSAEDIIFTLLGGKYAGFHPHAICTAYRKDGEQLSVEEKEAIGLQANAFISRKAHSELSKKGLGQPTDAHLLTLLRASYSLARYRTVVNMLRRTMGPPSFKNEYKFEPIKDPCPACTSLSGTMFKSDEAPILPPPECECVTAFYELRPHVNFLAEWDEA